MTTRPELSVVVPSVNGLGDLADCLRALDAQRVDVTLEVIVVDRCGPAVREAVQRDFPWVRVIAAPHGTTIPVLRATAFAEAAGEGIAVIEDHVIVPRGWARALCDGMRDTRGVVGGAVENAATERLVDRAAFLCEYSHCLPPLPAGPAEWLTGNNVVYPRALLERYRAVTDEGRWEDHLHQAMRRDGVDLHCRPEIRVGHKKHYTVREYLGQRYLYARSFAGQRVGDAPPARRAAFAFAAMALPPILLWRVVSRVIRRPQYRTQLVAALPLLALFVTSWSVGEIVGYWAGPGDSLARVC